MSLILTLSLLSMAEIITGLYIGGMFGSVFITGGISGIMVLGIILIK